jgi:hypothetical protein
MRHVSVQRSLCIRCRIRGDDIEASGEKLRRPARSDAARANHCDTTDGRATCDLLARFITH